MTDQDVATTLSKVTAALPGGGEERPGQVAMAEAVAQAIGAKRHLVVKAGTGTGKSLGYLVPLIVLGVKAVVATATKALQDQLATKDLPAVAAVLAAPLEVAVLKGRSNYLCLQRAADVAGDGHQQALDEQGTTAGETGRLVDQLRRLLGWGEDTATGDRAELDFEPDPRAWNMVSVGPRECPGAVRCPSGDRCFTERARRRAAEADVVVVNTHLYGAHLAGGGGVLPSHDVVVFDEAHELEEVMTASLGVDLSPGRFAALPAAARPLLATRAAEDDEPATTGAAGTGTGAGGAAGTGATGTADVAAAVAEVGERLRAHLADRVGERVLRDTGLAAGADDTLVELLELALSRVERVRAGLTTLAADTGGRTARALAAAGNLTADLERLAAHGADDVLWVDGTARAPVLRLSPVDVGPLLADRLWGGVTAVLTSATIPPALPDRLGMTGYAHDDLDVGSPFDYRTHSLLYVAKHLPDRRRAEAEPAIHDELAALITAAGGRTLALFTSRRATEAAAAALGPRVPFRLLVQGELPKGRLLETFAAEESTCLFATLGFWQGVDVPGSACILVTVDRLPFGRPDDPLLGARRERAGDAAFRLVDLPRAATLLAQGVGRLIRSSDDRGVVAVLDPRLATAGYRRTLLAPLPPMRRTIDRDEVSRFLADVAGRSPAGAPASAPDPA